MAGELSLGEWPLTVAVYLPAQLLDQRGVAPDDHRFHAGTVEGAHENMSPERLRRLLNESGQNKELRGLPVLDTYLRHVHAWSIGVPYGPGHEL